MKSKDFLKDLRGQSVEQLVDSKINFLREYFALRMQLGTKQLSKHHAIRSVRRNIARVHTLLSEKQASIDE